MSIERQRGSHERRGLPVLAWFAVLLAGTAAADDGVRYLSAGWQLDSPLGASGGILLGLIGPSGWWRLDIGLDAGGLGCSADDVMRRRGEGWTLAGAQGGGFYQAWHAPWRRIRAGTIAALEQMVLHWSSAQHDGATRRDREPQRWRPSFYCENVGEVAVDLKDLHVIDVLDGESATVRSAGPGGLRRRLVVRGQGRGGEGIRVQLRKDGSVLVVSSRRWPGRLTVTTTAEERIVVPAEAYLPLWPLADFLP